MAKNLKQKGKYFVVYLYGKEEFRKTNRSRALREFAKLKGKYKANAIRFIEMG